MAGGRTKRHYLFQDKIVGVIIGKIQYDVFTKTKLAEKIYRQRKFIVILYLFIVTLPAS